MIANNIKVSISGMEIEIASGASLLEVSKMFDVKGNRKPIIAKVNGRYRELFEEVKDGDQIEFLDLTNVAANRVYVNG